MLKESEECVYGENGVHHQIFLKEYIFPCLVPYYLALVFFGGMGPDDITTEKWKYNSKKKKETKKKMQYLLLFRYIIFAKADLWMIH